MSASPQKATALYAVFGLLIVLVGGIAFFQKFMLRKQAASIQQMDQRIADLQKQSETLIVPQKTVPSVQVIGRIAFQYAPSTSSTAEAKTYTLVHRCEGEAKYAFPDSGISDKQFCLGRNTLALISPDETEKVLSDENITEAQNAPLFRGTAPFGSDKRVIEYAADSCATQNNCGAGGPDRFVSMVLDLETLTTMPAHFPSNGKMFWNASSTKAVVFPATCGGAGCSVEVLKGYDLSTDKLKELTTEKAAESSDAEDVQGKKLPYWHNVTWQADAQFTVDVVQSKTSKRTLTVTF